MSDLHRVPSIASSHETHSANCKGFTLIEVMIVVVIIGILASIAIPSYGKYMTNARRTDAIAFLAEAAGEQARYFSENNQYAVSMKELGYGANATFVSPEGHYTISVETPDGPGKFELKATPVAGGKQADDTDCGTFILSHTGKKKTSTGADCW